MKYELIGRLCGYFCDAAQNHSLGDDPALPERKGPEHHRSCRRKSQRDVCDSHRRAGA